MKEVIDILRYKADREAKLLFRTLTQEDGNRTLVELSLEISKEINKLTDILLEELTKESDSVLKDSFYQQIVIQHCPPILINDYHDRILASLPDSHQIAIIASSIASFVVYNEGLGWLKSIPRKYWFKALMIYMQKDRLTAQLLESVQKATIEDKEQISAILTRSAARNLTILELQKLSILN